MHALDVLGDPTRRRILELLADGEQNAGDIVKVLHGELGLSQPAVSHQLKVLRDNGFTRVRVEGQRRVYAISGGPLAAVDAWLERFRRFWEERLDALGDEIARGKRDRAPSPPSPGGAGQGRHAATQHRRPRRRADRS